MPRIKCVTCGDGAVGKTCLLMSYAKDEFPEDYVPTVFDNHEMDLTVDGTVVQLSLWDTAGQEEYDQLRLMSYPQTDVFVVAFSVMSPLSLANVKNKWVPELKSTKDVDPKTPVILVGTKLDLRTSDIEIARMKQAGEGEPVSADQGMKVANEVGAAAYVECSALTQQGLKAVFDRAIREALRYKGLEVEGQRDNCAKKCLIL